MKTYLIQLIVLVCLGGNLLGQDQVHVITKKIHRDFVYHEGYEVNIDGDRAEVHIQPSLENKILIDIEIIAKNPDQEQAKIDVEKMASIVKRLKNKIYIRNYLDLDEAERPSSQIKVIYNITVPAVCPVYAKISYGIADFAELTNSIRVNSKFSQVNLNNISGSVDLSTQFGDIIGQTINGNVTIGSRRTNITLKDIQGNFDIDAAYGMIQIYADAGLLDLNLDAEKSQVLLFNSDLQNFRYNLTTVSSPIQYPDELNFKLQQVEPNVQRINYTPNNEFFPNITVKVTFGSLQIDKASKSKRP
jgi:hypothetical protein